MYCGIAAVFLSLACYDGRMDSPSSSTPLVSTLVPTPAAGAALGAARPHSMVGRPCGYSEETAGRLCEVIRRRGMSDTAAAGVLGIPKQTLGRWMYQHPELKEWLGMAREQYREAKLGIVDEAKTGDGRPDWHAAAWALQKAFPADYGRAASKAP